VTKVDDNRSHDRIQSKSTIQVAGLRVLSLVLLATVWSACAGDDGRFGNVGRSPRRVGVSPTYPPVIFENVGKIVGIEADLARFVGDALGRRIVFERYPFPELIEALERGEIDVVMSGLSITPERAERVRFTKPYMQVGQLALIRSSDVARFGRTHLIRRSGARVGYERGTSGERFVATRLTRSRSFAFDSVDAGIRSLRAGRIDYFVHDAPTVWRLAADPTSRDLQGLYRPLTEEHLAWAVRPGDTKLLTLLNTTLAHWKREGLIEPIVNRWIPVRVTLR
jgi:polar amino acid transport system substrate-binding protein